MLYVCFNRPEKYVGEALDTIIKFWRYKVFEHTVIREFHSLL